MRRLIHIAAISLLMAACSRPPDDGDLVVVLDMELGADAAADTTAEMLLEGELVTAVEDASEVLIYDACEFLFVVTDARRMSWLAKDMSTIYDFASWPDLTRPTDGPLLSDVTWDDTYFWLLTQAETGDWVLAGVEHFLSNPFPLFGQPIVIIDLGPIQQPRGLARFGTKFVVPTPGEIITVGEGIPISRIPLGGDPTFAHIDDGWLFVTIANEFVLQQYSPTDDALTPFVTLSEQPLDFAGGPNGVFYISQSGELRLASATGDFAVPVAVDPAPTPALATGAGSVAWAAPGEVRAYTVSGELRFAAPEHVDAVVIDATHVYWSGPSGIYRGDVQ